MMTVKEEGGEGGEVIVVVRGVLEVRAVLIMILVMMVAMVVTIMEVDIQGVVKEMIKTLHLMVMHLQEVHHPGLLILYQIYFKKGLT